MRLVKRDRLWTFVLLAALLGAVLPWAELLLPPGAFHPGTWGGDGQVKVREDSTWLYDTTSVLMAGSAAGPADMVVIQRLSHGLFPQVRQMPQGSFLNFRRVGWPLRAVYEGEMVTNSQRVQLAPASVEMPDLGMLTRYAPYEIPVGILWGGMLGNSVLLALAVGGGYAALAMWRGGRRLRRGECPECGYQRGGAAVCSECGSASHVPKG